MAQHPTEIEHPVFDGALCAQVDPELFFPEPGGSAAASVAFAKKVCRACPVRAECLQWTLDHDERWGVWGGLTSFERSSLGQAAS